MSFKILSSTRADHDLLQAAIWYETQSSGLGRRFIRIYHEFLDELTENPERFMELQIGRGLRRMRIRKWPFWIIYRIKPRKKLIEIVAIWNTNQNPEALKKRLTH